jgi:hypothetical protein
MSPYNLKQCNFVHLFVEGKLFKSLKILKTSLSDGMIAFVGIKHTNEIPRKFL